MIIVHVINDGRHQMTRWFSKEAVHDLIVFIRSAKEGSEFIMCDENNYPVEDTQ
jgi:hypothetical protein